ncbi:F-box protein At2g38590 [Brassica rapa]|uniref:F-box associated beta-propeller type 1 domain-containing protein n=1 Tax=Brassica campestris TaxID=3711 RepID=M4CAU9_BRACM|nr:F-box protein At2g38590 [Brassica rapa]
MRLPFDAAYHNPVTLSCVREEKLAVLFSHDEAGSEEFEMWITTKIEAEEVSRSKFLRVINPLISCNCFFIDEEKKVAMGFDEVHSKTFNIVGEAGCFKKLELEECLGRDVDWMTSACSYVRSLVNVKQPAAVEGKRKQQSEFEKQRYDQNMGRIVGLKSVVGFGKL